MSKKNFLWIIFLTPRYIRILMSYMPPSCNFYNMVRDIRQKKTLQDWQRKGSLDLPPNVVKQKTVKEYAKKFSIHTLIETGTGLGDMVYASKNVFRKIFSIELNKTLYEQAKREFSRFSHISIIWGDSGQVLPKILANSAEPTLFWLDAHYSGEFTSKGKTETPIVQELYHILSHPIGEYVILIDDAQKFIGRKDYPTIKKLQDSVLKKHPDWVFQVENYIIRIHKKINVKERIKEAAF